MKTQTRQGISKVNSTFDVHSTYTSIGACVHTDRHTDERDIRQMDGQKIKRRTQGYTDIRRTDKQTDELKTDGRAEHADMPECMHNVDAHNHMHPQHSVYIHGSWLSDLS